MLKKLVTKVPATISKTSLSKALQKMDPHDAPRNLRTTPLPEAPGKPTADFVLLERREEDELTKGGLIIPAMNAGQGGERRLQKAYVLASGPGRISPEGQTIPMRIKRGDLVIYNKYTCYEWTWEGRSYWMLREGDIFAVIS